MSRSPLWARVLVPGLWSSTKNSQRCFPQTGRLGPAAVGPLSVRRGGQAALCGHGWGVCAQHVELRGTGVCCQGHGRRSRRRGEAPPDHVPFHFLREFGSSVLSWVGRSVCWSVADQNIVMWRLTGTESDSEKGRELRPWALQPASRGRAKLRFL